MRHFWGTPRSSLWLPTIRGARVAQSAVPRLSQEWSKKVCPQWTIASDVDDVSRNHQEVCDEVHVVVFLPHPSGAPLPEHLIWARSSVLSGSNP